MRSSLHKLKGKYRRPVLWQLRAIRRWSIRLLMN